MANQPAFLAKVTITTGGVAKVFNAVTQLNFDYSTGKIFILDVTGAFYFGLSTITAITYTITTGLSGVQTVVIS